MSDPKNVGRRNTRSNAELAASVKKGGTRRVDSRSSSPISTSPKDTASNEVGKQGNEPTQLSGTNDKALRNSLVATELSTGDNQSTYEQQLKLAELAIQRLTLEKEVLTLRAQGQVKSVAFDGVTTSAVTPKPAGSSNTKPIKVKLETLMKSGQKSKPATSTYMKSPADGSSSDGVDSNLGTDDDAFDIEYIKLLGSEINVKTVNYMKREDYTEYL